MLHRPGAVVAGGDLALEVEVLERVVLGVDRDAVVLGVVGDPVGHRPRREHAVVLEAQVPVQAPRVVLLDDEALPAPAEAPSSPDGSGVASNCRFCL